MEQGLILLLGTGAALSVLLLACGMYRLVEPAERAALRALIAAHERPAVAGDRVIEERSLWRNAVVPSWQRLQRLVVDYLPANVVRTYSQQLARAGDPYRLSGAQFTTIKAVALVVGMALGVVLSGALALQGAGNQWPLVTGFCVGIGFLGPDLWLRQRRRAHATAVHRALPDAVDVLVVGVGAGLSFDGSVAYVATKTKGALASEFGRYLVRRGLGDPLPDALAFVAGRVADPDFNLFADLVSQSQRYGVEMSKALAAFSADLRVKRRQEAEARAHAAVVKILFPLVIFILPALFIIVLGPVIPRVTGGLGG